MAKAGLFLPQAPIAQQQEGQQLQQLQQPQALLWFDRVLADLGDGQSLQQSLSTFSGHVRRIRNILAAATQQVMHACGRGQGRAGRGGVRHALLQWCTTNTKRLSIRPTTSPSASLSSHWRVCLQSLVLLDEVGSGTDPAEGAALAAALLERLQRQARLTYATTHHAELKVRGVGSTSSMGGQPWAGGTPHVAGES